MKSFGSICKNHPELNGLRYGSNCVACQKEYIRKWQKENREKTRSYNNASYERNKEKRADYRRKNVDKLNEWKKQNPDKQVAYRKATYARNKQAIFARAKDSWTRRYRLIGGQALAKTYSKEIASIYKACPSGFNVDHIVPLRGKDVCGLHVPWNLQYLSEQENKSKGNKVNHG